MKVKIGAFLGGALFGVGLAIAGMTQPAKIVGFFDFFGSWDPSLAFVMLGAILVYTPVYRWAIRTWQRPVWAPAFSLPTRSDIDGRLVLGSAIFGVGWGLGGYCPGPAFTSVGARSLEAFTFGVAMLIGVGLYQLFTRMREKRAGGAVDAQAAAMIDG
ncbi:MAG: YeeE/YedE family protein [Deltaproteobacteria bacterium]|nr:YeeE/YedE family protein [Deltaproteobacteria bacterium]MBT8463984.1 YeeE/YedE family protein [Deltaproteobacteria bacterium]MBT8481168.1 YeeE/YedE family protein [Deltaproteobacteria bacterium]